MSGLVASGVAAVACSAQDPDALDHLSTPFPEPDTGSLATTGTGTGSGGGGGTTPGDDDDDATTKTSSDGGGTTPSDSGKTAADAAFPPLPALFAAAPAYSKGGVPPQTAASLAGSNHNFTPLGMNPFGQDCLNCHRPDSGVPASMFPWFLAGSVKGSDGNGLAAAQVIIVAPDGGLVDNLYTDTDGNLWGGIPKDITALPAGAQVLVRASTGQYASMNPNVLSNGGCNNGSCHGLATQGLPHVP